MNKVIKDGRGRIRCYRDDCEAWATQWRRVWIHQDNAGRIVPVCPIDDPQAVVIVSEHQEEADV
jgi:hypothetical protein